MNLTEVYLKCDEQNELCVPYNIIIIIKHNCKMRNSKAINLIIILKQMKSNKINIL